jgi:hypothetical protein
VEITEIGNSAPETGIGDITGFFGPSFLPIRWRNHKFSRSKETCDIIRYQQFELI